MWDGRLNALNLPDHDVEVLHFSTPSDLISWYSQQNNKVDIVYLVDYEFLGQSKNGLDLISELGIGAQSILVTSRFEEPQILKTAQSLKVRLIPKSMAGFVPINLVVS